MLQQEEEQQPSPNFWQNGLSLCHANVYVNLLKKINENPLFPFRYEVKIGHVILIPYIEYN